MQKFKDQLESYANQIKTAFKSKDPSNIFFYMIPIIITVLVIFFFKIPVWKPAKKAYSRAKRSYRRSYRPRRRRSTRRRR